MCSMNHSMTSPLLSRFFFQLLSALPPALLSARRPFSLLCPYACSLDPELRPSPFTLSNPFAHFNKHHPLSHQSMRPPGPPQASPRPFPCPWPPPPPSLPPLHYHHHLENYPLSGHRRCCYRPRHHLALPGDVAWALSKSPCSIPGPTCIVVTLVSSAAHRALRSIPCSTRVVVALTGFAAHRAMRSIPGLTGVVIALAGSTIQQALAGFAQAIGATCWET